MYVRCEATAPPAAAIVRYQWYLLSTRHSLPTTTFAGILAFRADGIISCKICSSRAKLHQVRFTLPMHTTYQVRHVRTDTQQQRDSVEGKARCVHYTRASKWTLPAIS